MPVSYFLWRKAGGSDTINFINFDILSVIDAAFIFEVSVSERVRRVQQREEIRFGPRVIPGGDMYEQQKRLRELIANKSSLSVEESADKLQCKIGKLDGTK